MADQHDAENRKVGKDADSEHVDRADSTAIKSPPAAAASSEPVKHEPGKDVSGERQRAGRSRTMTLSNKELALVLASAGAGGMGVMMAEENEQEQEERRRRKPKD